MDILHYNAFRHIQIQMRKIPECPDPAAGQPARHFRHTALGKRQDRDLHRFPGHKILQPIHHHDRNPTDIRTVQLRAHVKDRLGDEPVLFKIIVRQRMPEITAADDDHGMDPVHSQNLADLIMEIFYIIPVPLLTKPPEIVQILPDLGRSHLHFVAQLSGRNALHPTVQYLSQIPVISRQTFNHCFRYLSFFHSCSLQIDIC